MDKLAQDILVVYLFTVNVIGFIIMLVDKIKAKRDLWRIPEATLMTVAAIGGSIGSLFGMYTFRHKTKHPKFTIGIPVILVLQITLAIFIAVKFFL